MSDAPRRPTGSVQPPRESVGMPVPTAALGDAYTADQWDEEAFALFAEGGDPGCCPRCDVTGFYGPRVLPDGTRYRACRFCGLYQEVGGPVLTALPTQHDCDAWPEIARAPYIWWLPPSTSEWTCTFCEAAFTVADYPGPAPVTDPDHAWRKVPQRRNRFWYASFWANWPFTKGRVFL